MEVLKLIVFVFERVENIVGKGENAGSVFSKGPLPKVIEGWDCAQNSECHDPGGEIFGKHCEVRRNCW